MALFNRYCRHDYETVIEDIVQDRSDAQNFKWKEVAEIDQKPFPAKNTFSSVKQYLATIAMGAKIVQEITEYEQGFVFHDSTIRVLKQKDQGLIAVVELPKSHRDEIKDRNAVTISPGDRGFLCLEYFTAGDATGAVPTRVKVRFFMEFIEPLPSSAPGVLAAKLKPRQKRPKKSESDQSKGMHEDKPDLKTFPKVRDLPDSLTNKSAMAFVMKTLSKVQVPESLKGPDSIMDYIMKQKGMKGLVDTVVRHSEFVYVYEGMANIQPALKSYLALGIKSPVRCVDIYSPLEDKDLVNSDCMQLNQSQRAALELGRSAPGGFVVAHGGPGTGKTHFIVQAVKPFFLDKKFHRVLITSAGNRGADSIALELNNWLQSLDPDARRGSYVVRLHSVKTETNIFLKDAEEAKREALREMAKQAADSSQQNAESKGTHNAIYDHYRTFACGRFKGVDDERVQHISLSVGATMKERLSKHPALEKEYIRYGNGEIYTDKDVEDFITGVHLFMRQIISSATAVCATVSGVADELIRESYSSCEMIVVDEAARVAEYQWFPLLGFYRNAIGKVMVGDPDQMGPAGGIREEKSPLRDQMAHSLQARFMKQGFPSGFFDTQYRALPEIAEIYNKTQYKGRLKSGDETQVEQRPLAQAIIEHNKDKYGVAHSVVFFDVESAIEQTDKKLMPKFCNEYIVAVTNILENLINAGFGNGTHPATIAVLTPYRLEYKRLRYARTKMTDDYPQAADIVIETVDKIQGMEYDIVIIDPVVTHKVGFLDNRRLNVLFSRARSGLYVLGCTQKWRSIRGYSGNVEALQRLAKELHPYIKRFPIEPGEKCEGKNKYYNPGEFEQVPEKSTTTADIRKALLKIHEEANKKLVKATSEETSKKLVNGAGEEAIQKLIDGASEDK
ncbi:P-loop containing nucleoside triphosphate hydrolase protein [Apiospora sp. TS-2023a]